MVCYNIVNILPCGDISNTFEIRVRELRPFRLFFSMVCYNIVNILPCGDISNTFEILLASLILFVF